MILLLPHCKHCSEGSLARRAFQTGSVSSKLCFPESFVSRVCCMNPSVHKHSTLLLNNSCIKTRRLSKPGINVLCGVLCYILLTCQWLRAVASLSVVCSPTNLKTEIYVTKSTFLVVSLYFASFRSFPVVFFNDEVHDALKWTKFSSIIVENCSISDVSDFRCCIIFASF